MILAWPVEGVPGGCSPLDAPPKELYGLPVTASLARVASIETWLKRRGIDEVAAASTVFSSPAELYRWGDGIGTASSWIVKRSVGTLVFSVHWAMLGPVGDWARRLNVPEAVVDSFTLEGI
jgi:hypothetical protein